MTSRSTTTDSFEQSLALTGGREALSGLRSKATTMLQQLGYDPSTTFAIKLAIEEAYSNALLHGNQGDPTRPIHVHLCVSSQHVEIEMTDQGRGFDPNAVPDPTAHENIQIPSGRGIMLIRSFMTNVEIIPPGNRIRMIYRREA